ncbi:MAG: NUDIX hydrolase [Proteobacteria bacterium]|nr:NUDIX hydrolase [Pseudomonadota bacterium]
MPGHRDSEGDGGWRRTASQKIYSCPWFVLRRDEIVLPGGQQIDYHVIERGPWAMVVPILDDGRVVMERVYRWPTRKWTLECPSGALDGDTPEAGARRELEEETGYRAGDLTHLGHFASSNGYSDERFDVFLAAGLTPDGRVNDGPTALSLLLAAERNPVP